MAPPENVYFASHPFDSIDIPWDNLYGEWKEYVKMTLTIQQSAVSSLQSSAANTASVPVGFAKPSDDTAVSPLVRPAPKAPPRVGFGAGTVSTPTAAVRTLRGGVDAARRTHPTFTQRRQALLDRLEERRSERADSLRRLATRRTRRRKG